MASTAEVRAWAAQNGYPELAGGRGQIPADIRQAYDAAHPAAPGPADDYGHGTGPADFGGETPDPGFVAADDPEDYPPAPPGGEELPGEPEEQPARPGRARGRWFRGRSSNSNRSGRKSSSPRAARGTRGGGFKRISVAPLIEDAYSDMAWAAGGIPPLARLLNAQAPIAGAVLDPVVKDTIGDTLLQPLARNYERVKVGMALLGTPAALMATLATAPMPAMDAEGRLLLAPLVAPDGSPVVNEDGSPVMVPRMSAPTMQHKVSMLNLRYCVRAMADIAGGEAMARVQRRAEDNADRDAAVNDFIGFLLGAPVPDGAEETAAREARDAGLRLAGIGPE